MVHNPSQQLKFYSSEPKLNNVSPIKKKSTQHKSGSFLDLQTNKNTLAGERKRFSELMSDIQYF